MKEEEEEETKRKRKAATVDCHGVRIGGSLGGTKGSPHRRRRRLLVPRLLPRDLLGVVVVGVVDVGDNGQEEEKKKRASMVSDSSRSLHLHLPHHHCYHPLPLTVNPPPTAAE